MLEVTVLGVYLRARVPRYPRDHEVETLAQFDQLARYLEEQVGLEAPNPPETGTLDDEEAEEIEA